MSNEANFLNLPSHIINDILSRLPIKIIIQCKSVCKSWLNLISESEFTNLHLSRSPPCLIIQNPYCHPSDLNCFSLVEFEDQLSHHDFHRVAGTKIKPPKGIIGNDSTFTMVGSVNGLICLNKFDHKQDAVYIWNPITQESIPLPIPEEVRSFSNIVSYGFGLSSETRKHKVVRISQVLGKNTRKIVNSNCSVYALGEESESESWRRIDRHVPFLYSCPINAVFVNGNLHWMFRDQYGSELISCFDLETESFSLFPAPEELCRDFNLASLGTFGGNLGLCDNTSDYEIVIWTVREYGINNKQWVQEIVIHKEPADLVGCSYETFQGLKVFKDGDILLLWRDDILLSYDSRRQIWQQSSVHKLIKKVDDQMNEERGIPLH